MLERLALSVIVWTCFSSTLQKQIMFKEMSKTASTLDGWDNYKNKLGEVKTDVISCWLQYISQSRLRGGLVAVKT